MSARLGVLLDERYRLHDAGRGHPERPTRFEAIQSALEWSGLLSHCERIAPAPISDEDLFRIHPPAYVDRVAAACAAGRATLDEADCGICAESEQIARLAAGGVIRAASEVASGRLQRAFCVVRPPGHHAERSMAMGFCLYANVALAAEHLRAVCGVRRVAILDWDVHHGNGTQHIFESDPNVLFVSLHGHPATLYPGTGYEHEIGLGDGEGFTVNIPLAPRTVEASFLREFDERAIPAINAFAPEMIIISAGFDGHADDPLGNQALSDAAFDHMGRGLLALAARHCRGRLLSVLEGGYNLDVLRRCVPRHVELLLDSH